jgi:hypothetical protein
VGLVAVACKFWTGPGACCLQFLLLEAFATGAPATSANNAQSAMNFFIVVLFFSGGEKKKSEKGTTTRAVGSAPEDKADDG